MIITVDGFSGVGKGTLAKRLADYYGYAYMDTGLLFRRVAYVLLHQKGSPEREADILRAADHIQETEGLGPKNLRVEEVSQMASKISTYPALRQRLVQIKRAFAAQHSHTVFDGRDMGTEVFPQAEKKIFLFASPEVRAQRRYDDLKSQGIDSNFGDVLKNIQERDLRDSTRQIAPTKPAPDAFILDTSNLSKEEVFKTCVSFVEK